MVAVLACNQTRGGRLARAIAWPTTRVDATRESIIRRRFPAPYRQLTLRPARLITTSAPSSSPVHAPKLSPSHPTTRHGAPHGLRLSTTTSCPAPVSPRASTLP